LLARLAAEYRANQNLIVYIRADEDGPYKNVAALLDGCQRSGITRYSLRTEPPK
jgi:biopolymer transport protein ExbD